MYVNTYIHRWHPYSKGARGLADSLPIRMLRPGENMQKVNERTMLINWGASQDTDYSCMDRVLANGGRVLNAPNVLYSVTDKLRFFKAASTGENAPRLPPWTEDPGEALSWYKNGEEVMSRSVLNGHSGNGIRFFSDHKDSLEPLLSAHLFTKYVKKMTEWRVHIVNGEVIDVQRKMLRSHDAAGAAIDPKTADYRIRNLAAGFVYGDRDADVPEDVSRQASRAFAKFPNLFFGAVDVIFNEKAQEAYVLEINSAPGIAGSTLAAYTGAFKKYFESIGRVFKKKEK